MADILINKNYRKYDKLSRYSSTPFYYNVVDDKYMYGIPLSISKYNYDESFSKIIEPGDSLDSLSMKYYGSPAYYWVIADFNNILDPFEDLPVGETIKIPNISTISFVKKG